MQSNRNIFENLFIKNLVCHENYCAPDWGEKDCTYGYNKFYYFMKGEGTLIIQGDVYHPEPEELYLIPADTKHTYFHNPERPVYKYWCHFDLLLNEGKKLVYSKSGVKCTVPKNILVPVFERLIASSLLTNPMGALSEKSSLLEILRMFMEHMEDWSILPACTGDDVITRMNDYIARNIRSAITLKELADIVHLHPNYFTQYFKRHFGVSPIEYVNIQRLEKAVRRIVQNPDKSVGEVAEEVGFNDYRYFGRLFRKRYGITPSEYRNIHR